MNISIKLNKNFTTQFNRLLTKYGEEFARLNGFNDDQLSYTDFIQNFIDAKTVADSSVDGNANVQHKDIITMLNEMPKAHQKLLAFNKLFYEMNKKYGFKDACRWLELEWNKTLGLHDAHSSTFVPYCYKPEEMILVTYNTNTYYISFKDLYALVTEEEQYDPTIQQMAKFPTDLFVQDFDTATNTVIFTKVTRIVAHTNKRPMYFIKLANGLSQIVTDDHPIITIDGEKTARELTPEDQVFTLQPGNSFSKQLTSITTTHLPHTPHTDEGVIELDKDLGWLTGMFLSEGFWSNNTMSIVQNVGDQLDRIITILTNKQINYHIYTEESKNRVTLQMCPYARWLSTFFAGKTAESKSLPMNFIDFCDEFLDGIVAGMIDGDGTLDGYKHRHCQIRIASEVLCHQLAAYLAKKGVFCGDRTPHKYSSASSFVQKLPLFGIGFTLTNEDYFLQIGSIKINSLYEKRQRQGIFHNKQYAYNYGFVNVIDSSEFIDDCDIVYDITTQTGHFICNGILSHNCFAYDLKDLAEKGLFFIENFNYQPPQHLTTFIDFVKEHCSYACNHSAGAVAYPNLIPYMYYFWRKDMDNHYLGLTKEFGINFAKQQIQRLIYALNQPFLRNSIQSAFTNVNFFDHPYFEAIFGGAAFPDGSFMIDKEEEIIEFQKMFLEEMSAIRHSNMMTFPVSTISLLTTPDGDFVDEEFAQWACEHNRQWNDSNWFIDSNVTSLSSCCRLRNDIAELGYMNTIGGAALKVGSVKVSTINLARLAYTSNSEEEYLQQLEDVLIINLKLLDVQRSIIQRNIEKGLLYTFSCGMIDMEHLYSSIGIMGIFETMKTFGYTRVDKFGNTFYKEEAFAFGERIFKLIHQVKDAFMLDKEYHLNLEAIPGESMAVRFQTSDELLYPDKVVKDLPLYGNQWIPLGIKTTLEERIRIASAFSEYCSGGDILHINVDAPFDSFDKAWKMLKYVAKQGVKYFAFTGKISACADNHAFYGKVCPICGKPVNTYYSRIVGFFVPIRAYSKARKEEWSMRLWENINAN